MQLIKRAFICLIFFIGILSCKKEETLNTLSQKEWFKNIAVPCDQNTICKTYIYMALYKNMPVVYSTLSGALCDPAPIVTLYNLNGEVVRRYMGQDELSAFKKEVIHADLIYRCDD